MQKVEVPADGLETVREAAARLDISIPSCYSLVYMGRLPATQKGRSWRIPKGAEVMPIGGPYGRRVYGWCRGTSKGRAAS